MHSFLWVRRTFIGLNIHHESFLCHDLSTIKFTLFLSLLSMPWSNFFRNAMKVVDCLGPWVTKNLLLLSSCMNFTSAGHWHSDYKCFPFEDKDIGMDIVPLTNTELQHFMSSREESAFITKGTSQKTSGPGLGVLDLLRVSAGVLQKSAKEQWLCTGRWGQRLEKGSISMATWEKPPNKLPFLCCNFRFKVSQSTKIWGPASYQQ